MGDIFSFDYETSSEVNLDGGAFAYAEHPSTDILCFAIARNDERPLVWDSLAPGDIESEDALEMLREAAASDAIIRAFNAQFEVAISRFTLPRQLGIPEPDLSKWRCTMAMSNRAAIRSSLAGAAKDLGLPEQKDSAGDDLIDIFCKGEKAVTLHPPPGAKDPDTIKTLKSGKQTAGRKPKTRKTFLPLRDAEILWDWLVRVQGEFVTLAAAWTMLLEYCRKDVITERAVAKRLSRFELTGNELASFQFDLRMNYKGVPVNIPALKHAERLVNQFSRYESARFENVTGLGPNQGKKLLPWLQERGYPRENLQADTVEEVLETPHLLELLTPEAAEALKSRALLNFASLKKIPKMLQAAGSDGYVRGTVQWHGARTGRATGRIIQPQNIKKATIEDSYNAYDFICSGMPLEDFAVMWASPLEAIASCARHFIQPHEGMMLNSDYVGVEARIGPWLCGETRKLQSILDGKDQYKVMAAEVAFNIPYEQVTKSQRQIGKVVELQCIAEGQLVTTPRGLVPIEQVQLDDLVWDGIEWVRHEGVICKGEKEVIEYQGLIATPDHTVYIEDREGAVPFGRARMESLRLKNGGASRTLFRVFHADVHHGSEGGRLPGSTGDVQVRNQEVGVLRQPAERQEHPVPLMSGAPSPEALPQMAARPAECCKAPLQQSGVSAVRTLRGEGHRVSLPVSERGGHVGHGEPRATEALGDRSQGQQRALRGGQSPLGGSEDPMPEYPAGEATARLGVPARRMAVSEAYSGEEIAARENPGADHRGSRACRDGETEVLEGHPRKARVYDIVNAGPRHRFTVSGVVVSNCIYGTGGKGMRESLRGMGISKTLKDCNAIVKAFRAKFPGYPDTWKEMEKAAIAAIKDGTVTHVCNGRMAFGRIRTAGITYMVMKLPSGRRMYYPHPKVKWEFRKYDEEEMQEEPWKREEGGYHAESISFYGKVPLSGHWARIPTWGSRLFENACQAIGADFLNYGCLQAEKDGYDIRMIIHDEILGMDNGLPLEGFAEAFCRREPWGEDFPLHADSAVVPYYLKES